MSKSNQIENLQDHLFNQLERLKDPNANLELELKKANAMIGIGNVIVNSAKAQIEFFKLTNAKGANKNGNGKLLSNGKGKRVQHD